MFMVVMKNIHLKLIKKNILQHHIANEYKNSLFEEFTPATDIRDRGKSFYLDIMTLIFFGLQFTCLQSV